MTNQIIKILIIYIYSLYTSGWYGPTPTLFKPLPALMLLGQQIKSLIEVWWGGSMCDVIAQLRVIMTDYARVTGHTPQHRVHVHSISWESCARDGHVMTCDTFEKAFLTSLNTFHACKAWDGFDYFKLWVADSKFLFGLNHQISRNLRVLYVSFIPELGQST